MCGIAGICNLRRDTAPEESLLRRMLGAIRHRGPDEFGLYLDPHVALGSARLSIVDLGGGQQPISNEDDSLWIVFNGEIFNYIELRHELESDGHRFKTRTDTEVLLHLYEEHGPECLKLLNGDFAVAIWDVRHRELFLARDRVGVRPLFYTVTSGRLLFGSEIKAILADQDVAAEVDVQSLHDVFSYWAPLSPRTAFKGVREVPPGSYAIIRDGEVTIESYWGLTFLEPSSDKTPSVDEAADELAELLVDATRIRLRGDVPVGAYLSGGLDSSTLASIVRRETSNPLETFSIAFNDQQFDESEYQRAMAQVLGTNHHVLQATNADIGDVFPALIAHAETPILRTAPAPMYLLSRLVRDHGFKVVLTGEGADEFFAGYDIFKEAMIRRFWAKNPESQRRPLLLRRLYPDVPQFVEATPDMLAAFFGAQLGAVDSQGYSHLIRWHNTSRTRRFFNDDLMRAGKPSWFEVPAEFSRWHPLSRAQFVEVTTFMSSYLLSSQGDRPAMAHSVEGRFPFLDYRVIEFAGRLPARYKLRGLTEKFLLRKAAKRWLPSGMAARRKRPYRAPIHRAFFGERTPAYIFDVLSPDAIASVGWFKPGPVAALTNKLMRGLPIGETDQMALAGIISSQLWHHHFIRQRHTAVPIGERDAVKVCRGSLTQQRYEILQEHS